jgi:lipid-A-disaccharide synthase
VEIRAPLDVLIVAGEASGDLHGGSLARALHALEPDLRIAGMGGGRMREAGVRLIQRMEDVSVVGATEVVRRIPALIRARRALRGELRAARPRVLVLVDFPDFNLGLAASARRLGVPVVYFIPPQVWAWRRGRLRVMRRRVTRVLAVLPFEIGLYEEAGIPVEFVGHPLLDVLPDLDRAEARVGLGRPGVPLVGLLPGSRREEVRQLLPELLGAARAIDARLPGARFVLPLAPTIDARTISAPVAAAGVPVDVRPGEAHRVMAAADLVLVASGTATLEAACYGVPMVVVYRLSRPSYAVARLLVRGVSHISLPNIVAGRGVVPELIQDRARSPIIAETAVALLTDDAARVAQRAALLDVRSRLGVPGAAARAARAILREAGHAIAA